MDNTVPITIPEDAPMASARRLRAFMLRSPLMTKVAFEAHTEPEEEDTLFFRVEYAFPYDNYGGLMAEVHRGIDGYFDFRVWHVYRGNAVELNLNPRGKSSSTSHGQYRIENQLIRDIALWAFGSRP